MALSRMEHKGGAVSTTLTTTITNTSLSITIDSATGWPTGGANGKFVITIDPDTASEERILCSSRTGNVLTVALLADRGVDGTTAVGHTGAVAVVQHTFSGIEADDANRHITVTTDDDHTQYMKADGTRHDLTARHSAGTVVPTAAPTTITPDASPAEGAGVNLARATHVHGIDCAVAVNQDANAAAAEGASTSFARADHKHSFTTGAPVAIGDTLDAGSGTAFAFANHVHTPGTAAPVGTIIMMFDASAPTGWVLLNGQAISRTGANAALFAKYGTASPFGPGDGSTTFNVPDFQLRMPLGKNGLLTLGGTGGAFDHSHGNGSLFAQIEESAAGGLGMQWNRVSGSAWTSSIRNSIGGNAQAASNAFSTGAGVEGVTGTANPPYIVVNFMMKL